MHYDIFKYQIKKKIYIYTSKKVLKKYLRVDFFSLAEVAFANRLGVESTVINVDNDLRELFIKKNCKRSTGERVTWGHEVREKKKYRKC